ncbi:hypothetical protein BDV95DRAFT_593158 [Massariosphaeria phaeospora]|uniref:Uncharacterized protein n=1 Tax=Massariosphaeria phaeospora TaxID=100035 RepID=A0A7C8M8Q2_9PLEO|nr:hypothetical protein BDV95DRAFT_593158 [Massariosphaeria phaeospora]
MTPNLLLATQTLFSPHKWFKNQKVERPKRKTEHWDVPVPGVYEYIPGRGWYLVATDKNATNDPQAVSGEGGPVVPADTQAPTETIKMTPPVPVKYSKVVKRYFLAPDYELRKKYGRITNSQGKGIQVGFFRLDDATSWVQCWDEEGEFIPGPYKLWCIDARTGNFRHMLKGDDPAYVPSRANSISGEETSRRGSQDSRSTQFRSGPGSTPRDGRSLPSTRANSVKGLAPSNPPSHPASTPGSQSNSRRNSPKRTTDIQLNEAKARLVAMAREQAAAVAAAKSGGTADDNGRRGRPGADGIVPTR